MGVGAVGFQILVDLIRFGNAGIIGNFGLIDGVFIDVLHFGLSDIHLYAAQSLGDALEAEEVHDHIVLDVHIQQLVDRFHGVIRAAKEVGCVDAVDAVVVFQIVKFHSRVAHHGGQLDRARSEVDGADDDGIRAGALAQGAFIGAQQQHVHPLLRQAGVDAQIGNLHHGCFRKGGDIGILVREQLGKRAVIRAAVTRCAVAVVRCVGFAGGFIRGLMGGNRRVAHSGGIGRRGGRCLRRGNICSASAEAQHQYQHRDENHNDCGNDRIESCIGTLFSAAGRTAVLGRPVSGGPCVPGLRIARGLSVCVPIRIAAGRIICRQVTTFLSSVR